MPIQFLRRNQVVLLSACMEPIYLPFSLEKSITSACNIGRNTGPILQALRNPRALAEMA